MDQQNHRWETWSEFISLIDRWPLTFVSGPDEDDGSGTTRPQRCEDTECTGSPPSISSLSQESPDHSRCQSAEPQTAVRQKNADGTVNGGLNVYRSDLVPVCGAAQTDGVDENPESPPWWSSLKIHLCSAATRRPAPSCMGPTEHRTPGEMGQEVKTYSDEYVYILFNIQLVYRLFMSCLQVFMSCLLVFTGCLQVIYLDIYSWSQSLRDAGGHGKVSTGHRPVDDVVGVHHGNQVQRQTHELHDVRSWKETIKNDSWRSWNWC